MVLQDADALGLVSSEAFTVGGIASAGGSGARLPGGGRRRFGQGDSDRKCRRLS